MCACPAPVDVQTCAADAPTVPPWFAEVAVLARHVRLRQNWEHKN